MRTIQEKFNSSNVDQPRVTVITEHNSTTYQVDGLSTEFSVNTYKFTDKKSGKEISMKQYFYERYKINLYDKQPLLFVNKPDGRIYLPTQICNEASLPEDFTKDNQKMRDLQNYKVGTAQ